MMYKGKIIRSPENMVRPCTCGECSECLRIMKQEEQEMRINYERGLTDWRNF